MTRRPYTPVKSAVAGTVWPGIPTPGGRKLLALLQQFEQSEWQPTEAVQRRQYAQASRLAAHAAADVPFYAQRLAAAGLSPERPLTPEQWRRIPLLTREDIQEQGEALAARPYPKSHGRPIVSSTSGSTGKPVRVTSTEVAGLFWSAVSLRDHLWQQRDLGAKFVAVRKIKGHNTSELRSAAFDDWGRPVSEVFVSGPSRLLSINTAVERQLAWLRQERPAYLLSYPTNVKALIDLCRKQRLDLPGLRQVRTMAEIVTPELRAECREVLGVEISDMYSTQECGYIALQAPGRDDYLVQAETVLLEVLDADGEPCAEGETGRVVVTPLTNFAMPLLRYEIGDFATVGGASPCGRGLPVLKRILGRVRNMLVKPDGDRIWPAFGTSGLMSVAPVRQFQFVQQDRLTIEALIALWRPLADGEEAALLKHVHANMPEGMHVKLTFVDRIPRSEGGKYEDFVCRVTPDAAR